MSDLLALADRVEKEAAGSRELDALIWAEIDGRDVRWDGNMLLGKYRKPPHDECRIGYIDPGVTNRNFSLAWSQPPIPSYTASIDAAMLLVPEGMEWLVRSASHLAVDNKDQCYANVGNQSGEAHADTGSCALCAAALRALRNERLASRQKASVTVEAQRLADAMWQLLDDMGANGQSVCLGAKAEARVAYEPFRDTAVEYADWMSLADAERILKECGQ